jgi:cytochrome c biogenesis protein CcdA
VTSLVDALRSATSAGGLVALPLAFVGGILAGLNPCCIPLYPAAAATCCAGRRDEPSGAIKSSAAFVAGVATSTALLGVLAALAGRALTGVSGWASYVIALVPLVMGLHLLGWLKVPLPTLGTAARGTGVLGSFASGLLLSLVLAPCGTPVLASVLSFAAYEQSIAYGGTLLLAYGLGVGLPILVLGTAAGSLARRLDRLGWRAWVDRGAGVALLALGFYLLWLA